MQLILLLCIEWLPLGAYSMLLLMQINVTQGKGVMLILHSFSLKLHIFRKPFLAIPNSTNPSCQSEKNNLSQQQKEELF